MELTGTNPHITVEDNMNLKLILSFLMCTLCLNSPIMAQTKKTSRVPIAKRPAAKKPKKQSFLQQKYKEFHFGLSQITDRFDVDSGGTKGSLRSQMQGLNFTYTFYSPSQNPKWLYSYGLGATIGVAKGVPEPFQAPFLGYEAKNKIWFAGHFITGIDFRHSFRSRVGLFIPLSFRMLDFGFDDSLKVLSNDPFSFGVGARYIHAHSIKHSFSFSFAHQITWASTTWDLSWQYRL